MSLSTLINLALADVTPGPLVLPVEDVDHADVARLIAVWCDAHPGVRLFDRIAASRPKAREIKRPLAIYTGAATWDLAVTGLVDQHTDQFWMHCQLHRGQPLHELRDRYELELRVVPVQHIVLVIVPSDADEGEEELAHLRACRDLARNNADIIGVVWLGSSVIEDLPGPPPVVELAAPLGWGQGGPTP